MEIRGQLANLLGDAAIEGNFYHVCDHLEDEFELQSQAVGGEGVWSVGIIVVNGLAIKDDGNGCGGHDNRCMLTECMLITCSVNNCGHEEEETWCVLQWDWPLVWQWGW